MKKRFYGIDFLRLISIFCVVVLHTLGRSGLLQSDIVTQYKTAWLLETAAYYAVDVFGIISGFVNYSEKEKRLKLANIFDLWLQAVFYGLAAVFVFTFFTKVDVTAADLTTALFPLIKGEYWFFSAYTGMFLFSNLVNNAVRNTENKTLLLYITGMLAAVLLLESVSVKMNKDYSIFDFEKGYNSFWLLVMYFIGATIRKTEIYKRFINKKWVCASLSLLLILFSWIWLIALKQTSSEYIIGNYWERVFIEYISPTIVCTAIMLVILFTNIEFKRTKVISFFAPSAFSVYLLNSQPMIATYIYNREHLSFLLKLDSIKLIIVVVGISIAFVLAGLLIDKLRSLLFMAFRIGKMEKALQDCIYRVLLKGK